MADLTPQPPEWIHTAPIQVAVTRELAASPAEVFAALADHETWPEWFTAVERVERFGDQHDGVGSNRRVFINTRVSIDEEFNVWSPDTEWGFTLLSSTMGGLKSMNELVTIEELDPNRSRVTYKMGIEPKFFLAPVLKLGAKGMQKNLQVALDNLGPFIEGRRAS